MKEILIKISLILFVVFQVGCSSPGYKIKYTERSAPGLELRFVASKEDKEVGKLLVKWKKHAEIFRIDNVISPKSLPRSMGFIKPFSNNKYKWLVTNYAIHQIGPKSGEVYAGVYEFPKKKTASEEPKLIKEKFRLKPIMTRANYRPALVGYSFSHWYEVMDSSKGYIAPLPRKLSSSAKNIKNFVGALPIKAQGQPLIKPQFKSSASGKKEIVEAFTLPIPKGLNEGALAYLWETPAGKRWGFYFKKYNIGHEDLKKTENLAVYKSYRIIDFKWPHVKRRGEAVYSPHFHKMRVGGYYFFEHVKESKEETFVIVAEREDGRFDIVVKDPSGALPLILETVEKDNPAEVLRLVQSLKDVHIKEFETTAAEINKVKAEVIAKHEKVLGKCFFDSVKAYPPKGFGRVIDHKGRLNYVRRNCDTNSYNWMLIKLAANPIAVEYLTSQELQFVIKNSKYKPSVEMSKKQVRHRAYKKTDKYKKEQYYKKLARDRELRDRENRKTGWTYQTFTGATYTDAVKARYNKAVRSANEYRRKWKTEQEWKRFIRDSRK